MVRLWYKDGNYMDVKRMDAYIYEADPEWSHTEDLSDVRWHIEVMGEDGKWQLF